MRAIDADALIVQFRRAIETFLPNDPRKHMNPVDSLKCHGWEQGLMVIQDAPTIQPEPHWIPVTKEEMFKAGYEGREIRFRVDGRLFAIRELAQ